MTVRPDRLRQTETTIAVVSWLGSALLTIWTVSALGTYAVLASGTDWLTEGPGSDWPMQAAETVAAIDGLAVGALWLVGSALIVTMTLHLRRLAWRIG